jgi:hypothetical protein
MDVIPYFKLQHILFCFSSSFEGLTRSGGSCLQTQLHRRQRQDDCSPSLAMAKNDTLSDKETKNQKDWKMSQVGEWLPSMFKDLNSFLSTERKCITNIHFRN